MVFFYAASTSHQSFYSDTFFIRVHPWEPQYSTLALISFFSQQSHENPIRGVLHVLHEVFFFLYTKQVELKFGSIFTKHSKKCWFFFLLLPYLEVVESSRTSYWLLRNCVPVKFAKPWRITQRMFFRIVRECVPRTI